MRTYFERLEDIHYQPPSLEGHGTHGWLGTTLPNLSMIAADLKILALITSAANALGATLSSTMTTVQQLMRVLNPDINSDDPGRDYWETIYEHANSVTDAKRSGPRNFVIQVANATNSDGSRKYYLDIRLNCLVTKVRLDTTYPGPPKAVGVDFLDGKSLYKADPRSNASTAGIPGSVNTTREVIISGGTYNTPQLLKLSGIGPHAELSALGISTIVDLPGVGNNLQDRYEVAVIGDTTSDFEIWNGCTFGNPPDPCITEWQTGNGTDNSPYATNGLVLALTKKSSSAGPSHPVDLIIQAAPLPFKGYYPGYSTDAVSTKKRFSWVLLKGHTRNRAGTVKLRSLDPSETPVISFHYFDEGTTADNASNLDLEALVEGVQFARSLFQSFVLNGSFSETWPGPDVSSLEQIKQWITDEAWGHHACCTAPIGADGDPMAVLDSKFRVRGTRGLRVVDASVFPKIPGLFIVVPIYMVSEKAADVILQDAI
jgi:choline dehydrogenase